MKRTDQGLARHQRLTRSADFRAAFDARQKTVGRLMVMYLLPRPDGSLRLGVVSSRKLGNAVERSRARRLLREVFRRHRSEFSGTYDVVLIARRELLDAKWQDIEKDLFDIAHRAGIYRAPEKRQSSEAETEGAG